MAYLGGEDEPDLAGDDRGTGDNNKKTDTKPSSTGDTNTKTDTKPNLNPNTKNTNVRKPYPTNIVDIGVQPQKGGFLKLSGLKQWAQKLLAPARPLAEYLVGLELPFTLSKSQKEPEHKIICEQWTQAFNELTEHVENIEGLNRNSDEYTPITSSLVTRDRKLAKLTLGLIDASVDVATAGIQASQTKKIIGTTALFLIQSGFLATRLYLFFQTAGFLEVPLDLAQGIELTDVVVEEVNQVIGNNQVIGDIGDIAMNVFDVTAADWEAWQELSVKEQSKSALKSLEPLLQKFRSDPHSLTTLFNTDSMQTLLQNAGFENIENIGNFLDTIAADNNTAVSRVVSDAIINGTITTASQLKSWALNLTKITVMEELGPFKDMLEHFQTVKKSLGAWLALVVKNIGSAPSVDYLLKKPLFVILLLFMLQTSTEMVYSAYRLFGDVRNIFTHKRRVTMAMVSLKKRQAQASAFAHRSVQKAMKSLAYDMLEPGDPFRPLEISIRNIANNGNWTEANQQFGKQIAQPESLITTVPDNPIEQFFDGDTAKSTEPNSKEVIDTDDIELEEDSKIKRAFKGWLHAIDDANFQGGMKRWFKSQPRAANWACMLELASDDVAFPLITTDETTVRQERALMNLSDLGLYALATAASAYCKKLPTIEKGSVNTHIHFPNIVGINGCRDDATIIDGWRNRRTLLRTTNLNTDEIPEFEVALLSSLTDLAADDKASIQDLVAVTHRLHSQTRHPWYQFDMHIAEKIQRWGVAKTLKKLAFEYNNKNSRNLFDGRPEPKRRLQLAIQRLFGLQNPGAVHPIQPDTIVNARPRRKNNLQDSSYLSPHPLTENKPRHANDTRTERTNDEVLGLLRTLTTELTTELTKKKTLNDIDVQNVLNVDKEGYTPNPLFNKGQTGGSSRAPWGVAALLAVTAALAAVPR